MKIKDNSSSSSTLIYKYKVEFWSSISKWRRLESESESEDAGSWKNGKEMAMDKCMDDEIIVRKKRKDSLKDLLLIDRYRRNYFEEIDTTKEYAETYYYYQNVTIWDSPFWADFALHIWEKGSLDLLTSNIIYAITSPTEALAALALLDLPFISPKHHFAATSSKGVTIEAKDNLLMFKWEINATEFD